MFCCTACSTHVMIKFIHCPLVPTVYRWPQQCPATVPWTCYFQPSWSWGSVSECWCVPSTMATSGVCPVSRERSSWPCPACIRYDHYLLGRSPPTVWLSPSASAALVHLLPSCSSPQCVLLLPGASTKCWRCSPQFPKHDGPRDRMLLAEWCHIIGHHWYVIIEP